MRSSGCRAASTRSTVATARRPTACESACSAEVAKLSQQPGKNVQIPGSPTLVRSLLRDGLPDELSLMVHPIVVGSGMRLLDGITEQVRLKLAESTTLSTGVLSMTHQPTSA